jgi:hypothetical protein
MRYVFALKDDFAQRIVSHEKRVSCCSVDRDPDRAQDSSLDFLEEHSGQRPTQGGFAQ